MIDAIFALLNGILSFLNGILPDSPFATIIEGNDAVLTALGWLNWLFPVGTCLGIFGVWLGLLVAWTALDIFLDGAAAARNAAFGSGYTG